jgi:hypothetical protein
VCVPCLGSAIVRRLVELSECCTRRGEGGGRRAARSGAGRGVFCVDCCAFSAAVLPVLNLDEGDMLCGGRLPGRL